MLTSILKYIAFIDGMLLFLILLIQDVPTIVSTVWTEPTKLALIGGIFGLLGTIFAGVIAIILAIIARQGARAAEKVEQVAVKAEEVKDKVQQVVEKTEQAAVKAEEVKRVLEENTKETAHQMQSIHTLVNATHGESLRVGAIALKRVAVSSSKERAGEWFDEEIHKVDVEAAEAAEQKLKDHEIKQAIVDKNTQDKKNDSSLDTVS